MPQSLVRVVLNVVFSTKNRVPFLKDPEIRARLHAYIAGVLQAIGCDPILIGGVEDHVHILCNLSRTVTTAGLVEEAKKSPSRWMKEAGVQRLLLGRANTNEGIRSVRRDRLCRLTLPRGRGRPSAMR